jgi:hypothetical protein
MLLQLSFSLSLRSMAHGESWDTCQRRSPPLRRGAVRRQGTRVNARALLGGEVGSSAEGRMAAPEHSWMVRQGPEPQDTW